METATAAAVSSLERWVLPKVEERLSYVFSNNKHIESLDQEVKNLQHKKDDIDVRVEDAKKQGETVLQGVADWQKEANTIIIDSRKFLEEKRESDSTCFFKLSCNVVHLYKSGKEAANLSRKVENKIQEATYIDVVATPLPPAPIIVSTAATSGREFESREKLLDEVIRALQDETVDVVGIHGMGGVGKTTLVDRLILQAREQKLFSVIAKETVSQTINIEGIQNEIAGKIEYKFREDGTSGRRDELCQILSRKVQNDEKILIILDDVWESIGITTQIGIPRTKRCKVVVTTRENDILGRGEINANKIIKVGVLDDKEAKHLFEKTLGDYYDTIAHDSRFTTIMKGLVKRCGGLPLALKTVAAALKGKDHHIWKVAIDKLSDPSGRKIQGVSEVLSKSIMFSINTLQNEGYKEVLLLCSLFPEDAYIPVLKLVSYGFAIDLFDDSWKLDKAMLQMHEFVIKLVSCNLLLSVELDRSGSYCVRVHDVIRDVALDIASQDPYNFFTGTSWPKKKGLLAISLSTMDWENTERPSRITLQAERSLANERVINVPSWPSQDVSELRVLRLHCKQAVSIPSDFFKGMEKLKVLDLVFEDTVSFSTLDFSTGLKHLFLEALMVRGFPLTLENSLYLKVLDLSRCYRFVVNQTNFMDGLSQLEGLFANEQVINLVQLQALPCLQILHARLDITTKQHIPHEASKLKSLSSFKLLIAGFEESSYVNYHKSDGDKLFPMSLIFTKCQSDILISLIDLLPRGLCSLSCIEVEGLTNLKMVYFPILSDLKVCYCNEISCLFAADARLPELKRMRLSDLPLLEGIFDPKELSKITFNAGTSTTKCASKAPLFPLQELLPTSGASFSRLRVLKIIKLPRVTSVFPSLSLYTQTLTSLQKLRIEDCEGLEEVIGSAEEMDVAPYNSITLSLEILCLINLPSLLHIYEGKHTLRFPHLQTISIDQCDFFTSLAVVFKESLAYSRLEHVSVVSCKEMKYVFDADVELSELWSLELSFMPELEDICRRDGGTLWKNSFPKLNDLKLQQLPKIMNNNITDSNEDARTYLFGPEDVLPAIETMDLSHMNCTGIWHFPLTTTQFFSRLRILYITKMPHIKYVFPSIAFCTHLLTRLERLEISKCENLEEVVHGGRDEQAEDNQHAIILVFPALQQIRLSELSKLKHFYGGRHTLKFPQLGEVYITICESMESFSSKSSNTPNLTLVNDNQSTSEMSKSNIMAIDQDSHKDARKYLFGPQDVLPSIDAMDLSYSGCAEIWHRFPPAASGSFSQLRKLDMFRLPHIKYVFPSLAFCTQLTRLESLKISGCEYLEEVVYYEGGDDDQCTIISVFSVLRRITLCRLPKLKHFYGGRHSLKFPLLDTLDIGGCKSMRCFATVQPDAGEYLFSYEGVLPAIGRARLVEIGCAKLWRFSSSVKGSFSLLSNLHIQTLPHIKYVFPSLAFCTQLTRLSWLHISECENLEEVVYYEGGEEQVEDNQLIITSVFPALEKIILYKLSKLKHFYGGRHTLNFPLLGGVHITDCRSMEWFSSTLPDAPNLMLIDDCHDRPKIPISKIMA